MAWEISANHLTPDANGEVHLPDAPGLGMTVDIQAMKKYLVEAEIKVKGQVLYRTPAL
jgi:L-alanine-DL-glutamate epimerase-like enolase superfamily enzyme